LSVRNLFEVITPIVVELHTSSWISLCNLHKKLLKFYSWTYGAAMFYREFLFMDGLNQGPLWHHSWMNLKTFPDFWNLNNFKNNCINSIHCPTYSGSSHSILKISLRRLKSKQFQKKYLNKQANWIFIIFFFLYFHHFHFFHF